MRDPLTFNQGLMIAAGVSVYDDKEEVIEDAEVGTIKLVNKSWDGGSLKFTDIPTRPCTLDDFEGNSSLFYKLKAS